MKNSSIQFYPEQEAYLRKLCFSLSDRLDVPVDVPVPMQGFFVSKIDLESVVGDLLFERREARIKPQVPVVFTGLVNFDNSELHRLERMLREIDPHQTIFVMVLFCSAQELDSMKTSLRERLRVVFSLDAVVCGPKELGFIFAHQRPAHALRTLILSQMDITRISPYNATGPTPERTFFGRELELRDISNRVSQNSFALVGGRRIGKTSILLRLHRTTLPALGLYTIYHDCTSTPTLESFLNATIRDWRPSPPPNAPKTFGALLQMSHMDKPVVLLIDEADKPVVGDRIAGWSLFNALRGLANSGHVQVILCGERALREALQDPGSPLFNFANPILLGPLGFRAVEELVTRPMGQLEIELREEANIVRKIWDFTSGHPNIVQRICLRLVEQTNEQETRRIAPEDVDLIISNRRFQEEDFLGTYWERATPLEQIITLLMAQHNKPCDLEAVIGLLSTHNIQIESMVVKAALDRLEHLRSILKTSQAGYEFAVTAFPRVIANTTTAKDLLIVLKNQYQKNPMELPE